MITISQFRMARAALNITQGEVAKAIGLNTMVISDLENEKTLNPKASTLNALQEFYEGCGLEFTDAGGVRPSNAEIKRYVGDEGFRRFYDDVYKTTKEGGSIRIQNGLPSKLIEHLGEEFYTTHAQRMAKLSPDVKTLIKEDDDNLIGASFAKYRKVQAKHFANQTIYIYGDKVGFITFGDSVRVLVFDDADIANAQRITFKMLWDQAEDVH